MIEVALLQLRTPGSQGAALTHASPLIRKAADQGARLIVTPEGSNLLQRNRSRLFEALAPMESDPAVTGFRALATELGVLLLIGSAMVKREDGKAANRSILIDPHGGIIATYDKLHMFDVDLPGGDRYRKSATFEAGDQAVDRPCNRRDVRPYGLLRHPLSRTSIGPGPRRRGYLTVPAAFTRPTGAAHWEILLRARAIETGCWVLAPAQGGSHEDGRETWGHSMVVSPWGDIIALADHEEPAVLSASLDLAEVAKARASIPSLRHAGVRRPMIRYALTCETGHEFEAWFGDSLDFDDQSARGLLTCPLCDTREVRKQIMAPAVTGRGRAAPPGRSGR